MVWGFVTCGPNEALVVSGKKISQFLMYWKMFASIFGRQTLLSKASALFINPENPFLG